MNIECQSCHAKYAVPDDKVKGRKVKIACKKCKAPIIVDGTAPAEGSLRPRQNTMLGVAPTSGAGDKASQKTSTAAKASEIWTVAVTDDQHEQMTLEQIVSAYASEKIDADTFVWREGMTDWVGPFEVPELAAALAEKGLQEPPRVPESDLSSAPEEAEFSSGSAAEEDDDLPTMVAGAGDFANMMGTKKAVAAPQPTPSLPPAKPSAAFARLPNAPAPAATRMATNDVLGFDLGEPPPRSKAGADLFARVASAGSEADVRAQPTHKAPANSGLTGARNENSVLFSLDALVGGGAAPAQPKSDDVNVEDLLSMPSMDDAAPPSIANLTAGNFMLGSSGPLIQPDAPNVPEPIAPKVTSAFTSMPPPGRTISTPPKRGGSWVGVVGGLLFLGVLGYLGYTFLQTGSLMPREVAALLGQPTPTATTVAPEATPTLPATASATAAPSAAPVGDPGAAGATSSASVKPVTTPGGTVPTPTPLAGSQAGTAPPTPGPVPSPSPVAPTPTPLPATAAGVNPPKPTEAALPPFDVTEAKSALAAAAATASASCKQPNGPTGDGPVQVTFNPSGRATNAVVGGAFKGTVVGGCIARIFRTARVSKFSGEQRTVSKTVYIK